MRILMTVSLLVSLALPPALAQEAGSWLTPKQEETLLQASMLAAEKMIEDAAGALDSLSGKERLNQREQILKERAQLIKSYCESFQLKHQARQQLADFQRQCAEEEISGGEALEQARAINQQYQEAVTQLRELAADYKARFKTDVPDPYQKAVEHYFKPDPTGANRR